MAPSGKLIFFIFVNLANFSSSTGVTKQLEPEIIADTFDADDAMVAVVVVEDVDVDAAGMPIPTETPPIPAVDREKEEEEEEEEEPTEEVVKPQ